MRTYRAGQPPQEPAQVPDFLRTELASIEQAANRADPQSELIYLHAEPARVRAGLMVLADGSDWNPGSGEGVYRRNAANTAWVFVGAISSVAKTTPVDADLVPLVDSAASNFLKYVTWANIKATLKTYFDTLYVGRLIGIQTITATDTYTPTAGTASVIVEVQAPGGGSGGCVATIAGQWSAGLSGAGGGWGRKRITSGFSGVTVTIGAVGAAGAAGNNAGGTGGTTSFGSAVSCTGGVGGGGSGAVLTSGGFITGTFAAGGTATGADVSRPGGGGGTTFAIALGGAVASAGGNSMYSGGADGYTVVTNNAGALAASGYGGGARGPANVNSTFSAAAGAAGAPGIVIVYEYA